MVKLIAGIGSRETPANILVEMFKIGEWCKANNITIRSGHAEGADWAFERGAQEACTVYLPWKGFNCKLSSKAKYIVPTYTKEVMDSVYKFHPKPDKLSHPVVKLMARNGVQVMGQDMKEPVDIVVCWTQFGKMVGGTSQALRIAQHYGIPVINMYHKQFDSAEKVIAELSK